MYEPSPLANRPARKLSRLVVILFAIQLGIVAILAATSSWMNSLGFGGIVLVLPLFAAYAIVLSCVPALPVLSIITLRKERSPALATRIFVWAALVCNLVAAAAIVTGIILTIPDIIRVYS